MPNKLSNEKSPYLKQHENNPVDWLPWNKETLEKAKKLKKPIFLSVGYASCHWCHVMAHESFEDEKIAKIMNDKFINIKVCLLYTSPSPRDRLLSRMPSSA